MNRFRPRKPSTHRTLRSRDFWRSLQACWIR